MLLFKLQSALPPIYDLDSRGLVNILNITPLIDYFFKGKELSEFEILVKAALIGFIIEEIGVLEEFKIINIPLSSKRVAIGIELGFNKMRLNSKKQRKKITFIGESKIQNHFENLGMYSRRYPHLSEAAQKLTFRQIRGKSKEYTKFLNPRDISVTKKFYPLNLSISTTKDTTPADLSTAGILFQRNKKIEPYDIAAIAYTLK